MAQTFTSAEVAGRYTTSVRTVHRKVAAGKLAYLMKLPGRTGAYVFDAREVERVFGPAPASPEPASTAAVNPAAA